MSKTPAAVRSGRRLFAAIWQKVNAEFFDQERLVALDWPAQRLRYNKQIVDDASALVCAEKLLLLLNDKYSRLLEPESKSGKTRSGKKHSIKTPVKVRKPRAEPPRHQQSDGRRYWLSGHQFFQ